MSRPKEWWMYSRDEAIARQALAKKMGELVGVEPSLIVGWSMTKAGQDGPTLTLKLMEPEAKIGWDDWTEIRELQQQVPGKEWGRL